MTGSALAEILNYGRHKRPWSIFRWLSISFSELLRRQGFLSSLVFIALSSQIAAFFLGFVVEVGRPIWGVSVLSYWTAAVVASFATTAIGVLCLSTDGRRSRLLFVDPLSTAHLILVAVAGAALCVLGTILIVLGVNSIFGPTAAMAKSYVGISRQIAPADLLILCMAIGILVPLAEEFLFRKLLFERLVTIGLVRVYPLVSVVFFGLAHIGQSTVKYITIMMLGALCTWLFLRTRRLFWPWFAHSANNLIALGLAGLGF